MSTLSPTFLRKSLLAVSALALTGIMVPAAFAATSAAPAAAPTPYVKVAQNSSPWRGDNSSRQDRTRNQTTRIENRGDRSRNRGDRSNDRSDRNRSDRNQNRTRSEPNRNNNTRTVVRRDDSSRNRSRTVVQHRPVVQHRNTHNSRRHVQHRPVARHSPVVHRQSHRTTRRHSAPYRSSLGISFNFGNPGYNPYRWAASPYSFYQASYGGYRNYQSRTTCRRINIDGWHHGHRKLISVEQCSNPWDGTYIVQGSERVVSQRW